ncbi:hypothetical protein K9M48_02290 [Candidatus Gracilibacteria bacterium]|nr:hypothetical protein [Candidatus Gracilibacteria bacterium]
MNIQELNELGIVDTHQKFADLKIMKFVDTNTILLFKVINGYYNVYDIDKEKFNEIKKSKITESITSK